MQVFKKTNFDFIGMRYRAYIFSSLILGSGIVSLVMKGGPKLGIDFKGGNLIQLAFKKDIPMQDVRSVLTQVGYADAELQGITGRPSIIIRVPKGRYEGTWRVFSVKATLTLDLGAPDIVRLESKGERQRREVQLRTLLRDGMAIVNTSLTGVASTI